MLDGNSFLITRGIRISSYETVTSTNDLALSALSQGEEEGLVIVAKEQTAGKGRSGRKFYSRGQNNIYMSVLLRPEFSVKDSLLITVAASVAICHAIENVTGKQLKIKWVNDIFWGGRKVCGILTEGRLGTMNSGELEGAILGIGVNLFPFEEELPDDIANIAGTVFDAEECNCLSNEKKAYIAREIVLEFLIGFFDYYDALTERRFIDEYRKLSNLIGREVTYLCGNEEKMIKVVDIDNDGHLVAIEDGMRRVYDSGEISIGSAQFATER